VRGTRLDQVSEADLQRLVDESISETEDLKTWPAARGSGPLFLSPACDRLSTPSIDLALRSAHVVRHAFCTNLAPRGVGPVPVAEVAGHRRVETTRRYSLILPRTKEAAMEHATVGT
jgi:integrase